MEIYNYNEMKLIELKQLAKERGIKGITTKPNLIRVLKRYDIEQSLEPELREKYGETFKEYYDYLKEDYDVSLFCRYYKERKTTDKVITYGCFWEKKGIDMLVCEMDGVYFEATTDEEISKIANTLFDMANQSICYCQYLEGRKLSSYTKAGFKAELQRFDVRAELVQTRNIKYYAERTSYGFEYNDEDDIPLDINEGRVKFIGEELSVEEYLKKVKELHYKLFDKIFTTGILHIERLYEADNSEITEIQEVLTKNSNQLIKFNGRFPYERELRHLRYECRDNGYYPFWGCDSSYRRCKEASNQYDSYYARRR